MAARAAEGTPAFVLPEPVETVARRSTGEIVAGRYLLTVGGPDGSEARLCPPDRLPEPRRAAAADRPAAPGRRAALRERAAEVERLRGLLAQGRSIRVTGIAGSGRSALLDAVAAASAGVAPDGVIRLTGYRRTPADLLQDLYAATHRDPGHRPDRDRLRELLAAVGAVVVVDDLEFGGAALDELLDSAPECAFLITTLPDVEPGIAASGTGGRLVESPLGGLSRDVCLELLADLAGRPLDDTERVWAVDLWFESEGLPLRFVQAGAVLRHRDAAADALAVAREEQQHLFGGADGGLGEPGVDPAVREEALRRALPLPSVAESAAPAARLSTGLSDPARAVLRLAVALGGECPTAPHLPALLDVGQGEAALAELVECGLVVPAGAHHRLAQDVRAPLAAQWRGEEPLTGIAQHFAWWVGHSSVTPGQVAAEAEVLIAAMFADREAGRHSAVALLARAAAPAFALGLRWGAWEQTLRLGLEAARAVGAVADEAWFRHELGVLALAMGAEDQARAEFDASLALRGALGAARGGGATRRMLALLAGNATPELGGAAPRALPGRAGQLPWRRSRSASLDRRTVRLRAMAVAGAGVVVLAVVGTVVGLVTGHDDSPAPDAPTSTAPGRVDGAGPPVNGVDLDASTRPSLGASLGATVEGTSLPSGTASPGATPTTSASASATASQSTSATPTASDGPVASHSGTPSTPPPTMATGKPTKSAKPTSKPPVTKPPATSSPDSPPPKTTPPKTTPPPDSPSSPPETPPSDPPTGDGGEGQDGGPPA
ncbi:ATP-binding protein [Streptomyces sp. NPDC092296]|uniref:ATP-binding protein n=1 Tax=Streptomyces sp. NPDC092296 TaxID=3366012 RepID=UPI0038114914